MFAQLFYSLACASVVFVATIPISLFVNRQRRHSGMAASGARMRPPFLYPWVSHDENCHSLSVDTGGAIASMYTLLSKILVSPPLTLNDQACSICFQYTSILAFSEPTVLSHPCIGQLLQP
ncbi:hypothetical protein BDV35DRAFT_335652 [Aspergillus flavus]|uniref:Uncharacterized protein n=1 Tax=Aspergillus flavus TaxID=5059 RepID=A0A5N6HDJ8_ASPFL|nr:hypothetical protein BDV35DRAFT_335652 [Aspergillus flavus]